MGGAGWTPATARNRSGRIFGAAMYGAGTDETCMLGGQVSPKTIRDIGNGHTGVGTWIIAVAAPSPLTLLSAQSDY
jgi:hypothetical protein